MTGPLGEAVPGLAEEETKNVKESELGYYRRDPAISIAVQVRAHLLFSFLCVLGSIRKFVYLVFTYYVSNISNTRKSVSSDIQTLRRGLKKRGAAEFF